MLSAEEYMDASLSHRQLDKGELADALDQNTDLPFDEAMAAAAAAKAAAKAGQAASAA
jgi:hypothetical protein